MEMPFNIHTFRIGHTPSNGRRFKGPGLQMAFPVKAHITMMGRTNGSALIMVLWTLVLISFLAGEYLEHNRGKACLAVYSWDLLQRNEAIDSVFHLFAAESWLVPGEPSRDGAWTVFSPNDINLWVKVENESKNMNINTAPDSQIREKVQALLGEESWDEADRITDAILDWRDTDVLVRTNGAEQGDYDARDIAYRPSNGPFKVLTEMLLVRGVSTSLFWGDPMSGILTEEEETKELKTLSLLDAFTIYPKDTKRVSLVIPGRGNGYSFVTAFLVKKNNRWEILQVYRTMLVTSGNESELS